MTGRRPNTRVAQHTIQKGSPMLHRDMRGPCCLSPFWMGACSMEVEGIHHVTAISAQIREKKRFYTETLGMRLVKRSVNQDDVSAYHLFYADAIGSPGSDLTFFDWPVPRERRGTPSIVRTCLRVNGSEALTWWSRRFDEQRVQHGEIFERDGRL